MKLRSDLRDDPRYDFMVGRLVGAAEMTAVLLAGGLTSQAELAECGRRLETLSLWFLPEEKARLDG